MKIRNPKSRNHLKISKKAKVLEVGGGHNPHKRSNVVVDKYIDSNYHRSGDVKVLKNQKFIQSDGANLPFEDNEFDYVICNQVLEHVDDPIAFLKEQCRVSKKGYLEAPSLIGEYLHPKASHKWLILEINGKIVMMDKEEVGFKPSHDLGEIFLHYLPKNAIGFKLLQYTHGAIQNVCYEWTDDIEVIVNPSDPELRKYFEQEWSFKDMEQFLPKRSLAWELLDASKGFSFIIWSVIKSRLLTKISFSR